MDFNEFLAEDNLIEIIPKFKYAKKLNLISGDFGPFVPPMPTKVPIWLALNLKKKIKCEIIVPEWVKELKKKLDTEFENVSNELKEDEETDRNLDTMHQNWREILKIFENEISLNFKPLIERREAILKESIHMLLEHAFESEQFAITDVNLDKITKAELHLFKTTIQKSFSMFQRLRILLIDN